MERPITTNKPRTAAATTLNRLVDGILAYYDDDFSAKESFVTREEASQIAGMLIERWLPKLLNGYEISCFLDDLRQHRVIWYGGITGQKGEPIGSEKDDRADREKEAEDGTQI